MRLARTVPTFLSFALTLGAASPQPSGQTHLPLSTAPLKVAIIGGGAGGTSSAYFLSQQARAAGRNVDIRLFERTDYLGGRSTIIYPFDDDETYAPIEAGASVFIDANLNLQKATKLFDLSPIPFGGDSDREGIWNGRKMVYEDPVNGSHSAGLLKRYGAADLTSLSAVTTTAIESYLRVYNSSFIRGGPYSTVDKFTSAISSSFARLTSLTASDYFRSYSNISSLTVDELVEVATRVNYGQDGQSAGLRFRGSVED